MYAFFQRGFDFGVSRRKLTASSLRQFPYLVMRACLANAIILVIAPREEGLLPLPATMEFDSFHIHRMAHALRFATLAASIIHTLSLELGIHATCFKNNKKNAPEEKKKALLLDSVVQQFLGPSLLQPTDFDTGGSSLVSIDEKVLVLLSCSWYLFFLLTHAVGSLSSP